MDRRIPIAIALALCAAAQADELSTAKMAVVERDLQAASAKVDASHGYRPSKELSSEERREIIREQQAAAAEVLERHGVNDKELAVRQRRLSRAERDEVNTEKERLDREEAKRRAAEATSPSGEIEVQRGIDDKRPVDLHRDPDQVPIETLNEDEKKPEAPPPPAPPPRRRRR